MQCSELAHNCNAFSFSACTAGCKVMQLLWMQGGKWEARLGQSKTRKHSYLGLFDSEEEAAKAYDTATIGRFGHGMAINFDLGQVSCAQLLPCLAALQF